MHGTICQEEGYLCQWCKECAASAEVPLRLRDRLVPTCKLTSLRTGRVMDGPHLSPYWGMACLYKAYYLQAYLEFHT